MAPPVHPVYRPAAGRIAPVDGLRAVAVLGVVWIHVWTFSGNPALRISLGPHVGVDLERVVAIVGNGVNLFFVLSGFCMYWMFARRRPGEEPGTGFFLQMIGNRWRRLAPAFYAAALLCAAGIGIGTGSFPWYDLLSHLAFLQCMLPGTGRLAAPFWSLTTEWQFYLFLPWFLAAALRATLWTVLGLSLLASLTFRAGVYGAGWMDPLVVGASLPMHLGEFCWGIAVAALCAREIAPPRWLRGTRGFLLGAAVAYAGRVLMVTEAVSAAGRFGPAALVLSEPILTLGCALMLWNVVTGESVFRRSLSWGPLQLVGRWSYSIYLVHWWPCTGLTWLVARRFGQNALAQLLAFVVVTVVLLPLGGLFYHGLEAAYFQRRRVTAAPVAAISD